MPFADRDDAGERLGRRVAERAEERAASGDPWPAPIVLAIPRGGLPVGAGIARALGAPLDVLVAHKLGAPFQPELAIGAVAADGTVLVESWAAEVAPDEGWVRRAAEAELERTRSHERILRAGRPPLRLTGRTALIVDDGIATGATVRVGVLAARAAGAARVVVAAPVGAADSVAALGRLADEVIVLATPDPFFAVGEFYVRFDQVDDAEVRAILAETSAAEAGEEGASGAAGAAEESGGPAGAGAAASAAGRGRGHRTLAHTADVGLEARAPDLPGLLEEAAAALGEIAADVAPGQAPGDSAGDGAAAGPGGATDEPIVLEAPDLPALAFAWLNELIGLADARRSALASATVDAVHGPGDGMERAGGGGGERRVPSTGAWRLEGGARLVPFGPSVRPRLGVKSATYHGLVVGRGVDGTWSLTAYLDV